MRKGESSPHERAPRFFALPNAGCALETLRSTGARHAGSRSKYPDVTSRGPSEMEQRNSAVEWRRRRDQSEGTCKGGGERVMLERNGRI